ncbi:MAG: hypothetical protein ACI8PB_000024 [Desulforhopalus sp.]|jgi:hypothetical protein
MAQRLGVSVSDDLYTRIQNVKETLKVSKICQSALESAVELEEMKGSESLELLAKRIKIEKGQYFKCYHDEGVKDGKQDALSFSYEKFLAFAVECSDEVLQEHGTIEIVESFFSLAPEPSQYKCNDYRDGEIILNSKISKNYSTELIDAEWEYVKGWKAGVELIWNEVEQKIKNRG